MKGIIQFMEAAGESILGGVHENTYNWRPRGRDRLLKEILDQENWIVEGVYYAWCGRCFKEADQIYLLRVLPYKYKCRLLRRFIRRNSGGLPGQGGNEVRHWGVKFEPPRETVAALFD